MNNRNGQQRLDASGKQKTTEKQIIKPNTKKEPPHAGSDIINTEVEKLNTPGSAAQ